MASSANRIVLALAASSSAFAVSLRSSAAGQQWEADDYSHPPAAPPLAPGEDVVDMSEHGRAERRIYESHWWPLKPPPHHHPGHAPWPYEWKECQLLEENYTRYWRGLSKLEAAPGLLAAQQKPYFKLRNWRTAGQPVPVPGGEGELVFICHHKTGENLHTNIKSLVQESRAGRSRFTTLTEDYEPLKVGPFSMPTGVKVLHMVRDPVDVIVSGYRYHQNKWGAEAWSWGHGKLQDPQCFECDDDDHAAMFESCRYNCTYFELLNRLDETSGIATEAISARKTVTSMAATMAVAADNNHTLQISMGLIRADPAKTAACLLNFLGLDYRPELLEIMTSSLTTVRDPDHVTGGLYDNSKVKAFLRSHPVWGPEFREVSELMSQVFRRQAALYGCPEGEQ